jgi:hypothetical protein
MPEQRAGAAEPGIHRDLDAVIGPFGGTGSEHITARRDRDRVAAGDGHRPQHFQGVPRRAGRTGRAARAPADRRRPPRPGAAGDLPFPAAATTSRACRRHPRRPLPRRPGREPGTPGATGHRNRSAALRTPPSGHCPASAPASRGTSETAPRATGAGRLPAGLGAQPGRHGQAGPAGPVEQPDHFWQAGHGGTIRGKSAPGETGTPPRLLQIMLCAGLRPARLVVTHRRRDWRLPGRCVRPSVGRGAAPPR